MFGSQPVLPGQFLGVEESPSPSFIADFQGVLAARKRLQTAHHVNPGPPALPEELLLSRFVLVRHNAAVAVVQRPVPGFGFPFFEPQNGW